MSFAMHRLPAMHITMVKKACNSPVGSNRKKGSKNLDSMVNIGWKTKIGKVFLPIYSATVLARPLKKVNRNEEKHKKQTEQIRMDIEPQSWKAGLDISRPNGKAAHRLFTYTREKSPTYSLIPTPTK